MDTATQHAVALAIVHEEAGRTLSKADFDLCMRIAKRSLCSAETEVPWISVHNQPVPITARGTTMSVIVACKRVRDGETYVFAAEYANEFELEPGDDEDTRLVTGWFVSGLDSTGEFNLAYQAVCGEGDEITHWMLMPGKPGTPVVPTQTLTEERFAAAQKTFHSIVVLEMSELCHRTSPNDAPDAMVANDREMAGCIERALERIGCVIVPRSLLAAPPYNVAAEPSGSRWKSGVTTRSDFDDGSGALDLYTGADPRQALGAGGMAHPDEPVAPERAIQRGQCAEFQDAGDCLPLPAPEILKIFELTKGADARGYMLNVARSLFARVALPVSMNAGGCARQKIDVGTGVEASIWPMRRVSPSVQVVKGEVEPGMWRELTRRLYVELFHCDQQMRGTRDEDGDPHWTQSSVVRDVLRDAKSALGGGASMPPRLCGPGEFG